MDALSNFYCVHMQSYEQAFEQIKEATGITDIDQLVTKFIEGVLLSSYMYMYTFICLSCAYIMSIPLFSNPPQLRTRTLLSLTMSMN